MAENTLQWWPKALGGALSGIRSGFGLIPRAPEPKVVDQGEFLRRLEEVLDADHQKAGFVPIPRPVPVVTLASATPISTTPIAPVVEPTPVVAPIPAKQIAPEPVVIKQAKSWEDSWKEWEASKAQTAANPKVATAAALVAEPCAVPEPCVVAEPRAFVDPFATAKPSENSTPFNVSEFLAVAQPPAVIDAAQDVQADPFARFTSKTAAHATARTAGGPVGNPAQAGFDPRARGNQSLPQAHAAL